MHVSLRSVELTLYTLPLAIAGKSKSFSMRHIKIVKIFALISLLFPQAYAGGPLHEEAMLAYSIGDYTTAYQLWKPLAEHGDVDAQFALGSLYYDGIGVPVDHTESSYWYHLAADQGHASAQYNMGNAYMRGEGVRQDRNIAIYWWKKAAKQGISEAQTNLEMAYRESDVTDKDKPEIEHMNKQPDLGAKTDNTTEPVKSAECDSWLAGQPPNAYTIQLISTRNPKDAYDLARQHDLEEGIVCRYTYEGHVRSVLLFGVYPSVSAAREAVTSMPSDLTKSKPWIRKIRGLQKLVDNSAL
jgi:TPR repeat protein